MTITVPDDYPTIQAAINAANPGDTIYVRAGTYNGQVIVNKTVSLIGENRATTVINETLDIGDGHAVIVQANGVLISNFTITGHKVLSQGIYWVYGDGIAISGYNNTSIINVAIPMGNAYGIVTSNAYNTSIIGSIIDNNIRGVEFIDCTGVILTNNQFKNNRGQSWNYVPIGYGLTLYSCNEVTMRGNQFNNNIEDFIIDGNELSNFLHDIDTSNVLINGVTRKIYYLLNQHDKAINITGYPDLGCLALVNSTNIDIQGFDLIDCSPAILLAYTNNSVVKNNSITYCTQALSLVHSSNNIVAENNFSPNNTNSIRVKYFSTNNTIENNNVQDNSGLAFQIMNSSENIIANNEIRDNPSGGIYLEYSDNNLLIGNNVTNCGSWEGGIRLQYSRNATLRNNLMQNNSVNFRVVAYFDTELSHFIHDIDPSNLVDGKHIYYLINHHNEIINPSSYPDAGFLALVNSTGMTAQNLQLQGILLGYTDNSLLQSNTIQSKGDGITMVKSPNNNIKENSIIGTDGVALWDRSHSNNINRNSVTNASDGVSIRWYCENNTITENQLVNNYDDGIRIDEYSHRTVIMNNNAANNQWCGIDVSYDCNFCMITGNNATGNNDDGIRLSGNANNTVLNNYIAGNRYDGIRLDNSANNTISNNKIKDHGHGGIGLRYDSGNNTIIGNNISNSTMYGIQFYILPTNNIATGNNITDSGQDGINVDMSGLNTINGNNITNSGRDGIYVEGFYETDYPEWTSAFGAMNNSITNNIVTRSGRYGIYMLGYNNSIFHNRFIEYSQSSFSDADHHNIWDDGYPSGGNFWSDYNGTDLYSGPNQNIPGGDGISDTPYFMNANNTDNYPLLETLIYTVGISAYCYSEGANVSVPITIDGVPSGQNTSAYFPGLQGTHNITVPETDANGHKFKQWNTGETTTTITVTSAGNYIAYYGELNYTLTIYTTGQGTVTPGNGSYTAGSTIDLKAYPAAGWTFTGWSGDTTGNTNTSITMNGNKVVYATFTEVAPQNYSLTMIMVGEGIVLPGNGTYAAGATVDIKAINAEGWVFDGWSGDASGKSNTTITMNSNKTIIATFTKASNETCHHCCFNASFYCMCKTFSIKMNCTICIGTFQGCNRNITSYLELFNLLYADINQSCYGTNMSLIDQCRIGLAKQLVIAILIKAEFSTNTPIDAVTGKDLISAANLAYSGSNTDEMLRLTKLLKEFNDQET